jgi:hypothetical protein
LLSIGTPDRLEVEGEIFLEVEGDLSRPGVPPHLLEWFKQLCENFLKIAHFRYSLLLASAHGFDDDLVALDEIDVDIADDSAGDGVSGLHFWFAEQSPHSFYYFKIIAIFYLNNRNPNRMKTYPSYTQLQIGFCS